MAIPGSAGPFLLAQLEEEGGYEIERSLRFNSSDSAYLSRTPGSASSRKTWTWAGWVKRTVIGETQALFGNYTDGSNFSAIRISNDYIQFVNTGSGGTNPNVTTPNLLRDPSAWYHIVCALDTTQATSSNRVRVYINGVGLTTSGTYPDQNADLRVNTASLQQNLGAFDNSGGTGLNGYLADIHFIDGQALDPSSFGEFDTNGVWQPIDYAGTFGTNGFHLPFSDNSTAAALGTDTSGNGNTWTVNNISVTAGAGNDSLVDSPTNGSQVDTGVGGEVVGNYCTWNPLTGAITLTNGNLDGNSTGAAFRGATGTAGVLSGKWYWESTIQNTDSGNYYGEFGFIKITDITGAITVPSSSNGVVFYSRNGNKYSGGSATSTSSSGATTGDIVQVAIDLDAGKIWFGVNNTWVDSGNPASGTNAAYTGLSGTYLPTIGVLDGGKCNTNFGQRPFAYTAPSGFKALTTANLPTPLIANGANAMDVKLYTGNGSTQTISGLNFSPDLVWIKGRSGATDHALYDAVRGVQQQLECNTTTDETTESTGLTAFNSDGFALGALAQANTSSATYAAWCWNESVSAGFDIVTYTGNGSARTIAHSLGVAPSMIIVKARTTASTDQGWPVYHSANTAAPETDYLLLNSDAATADLNTVWNDTAPTSSVFSVGTNALVNANADTYVAYCFAPVSGYSSFGSYVGNGSSTNGPFVYLGFRPKFILFKSSTSGENWDIYDSSRSQYNLSTLSLQPNLSGAEYDAGSIGIDFLSNGFKLIGGSNTSSQTYIYAAFAENPFQYARAR